MRLMERIRNNRQGKSHPAANAEGSFDKSRPTCEAASATERSCDDRFDVLARALSTERTNQSGETRYRSTLCDKSWTAFTQACTGRQVGVETTVRIISLLVRGFHSGYFPRYRRRQTDRDRPDERCRPLPTGVAAGSTLKMFPTWMFNSTNSGSAVHSRRRSASREKYVGGGSNSCDYTAIEAPHEAVGHLALGRQKRNRDFCVSWQAESSH